MIFVRAVVLCGASVSKTFTLTVLPFQKGPLVEALSPPAGLVGTKVVLTGINFERVSEVRFNGLPASFTIDSPSQVTAVVPTNATTGPITVSGSGGATVGPVFTVIRTK
ncbi:MAG: hypothetical protein K1Y36_08930 [Blastocatellia bacterium]|nr:hypothetical protein [Blastocatellia bacterium]